MSYQVSGIKRSGHFQTVFPTLFRRVDSVTWQRERIDTPDDDFIDLDWLAPAQSRLVILCHGLEGSSDTHYMKGMARACVANGWDVLAYNFRGCSGEPNRRAASYHSGSSDDIALVINHALATSRYQKLALIGFSLGGNQVLKYLGEPRNDRPNELCGGVAISPPCDLAACADTLTQPQNWIYQNRFLRSLEDKINIKRQLVEKELGPINQIRCSTIREFDDRFVGPLNGFKDADDYYYHSNSRQFLPTISKPSLLISAFNDPLLPQNCYPPEEEINNSLLTLNYTRHGGHVSFMQRHPRGLYWAEQQSVAFLESITP